MRVYQFHHLGAQAGPEGPARAGRTFIHLRRARQAGSGLGIERVLQPFAHEVVGGDGGEDGRAGSQTSIAQAASAVYMDAFPSGEAIGVIQFTLHPTSADYAVYDANNGSIVDSGTVTCH